MLLDNIIKTFCCRIFVCQILKGNMREVVVYRFVQTFPEFERLTGFFARTQIFRCFQATYGSQTAFCNAKNFCNAVFGRLFESLYPP